MKKIKITVGLNDKDTKKQKHFTKWYYKRIFKNLEYLAIDGATLTESLGYYRHENGETVKEKSINIELLFIEEVTVRNLAKLIKKEFNQESVIFAVEELNSELI